jgi:hypothetical protein
MVWPGPDDINRDTLLESFGHGFVGLTTAPPPCAARGVTVIAISVYPDRWSPLQRDQWNELVINSAGVKCGLDVLEGDEIQRPSAAEFRLIGYDTADWGLISAVSNCGIRPEEGGGLYGKQWGHKLNHFHPFDTVSDADEFVDFANQRVPEHAPFFVFGLWCRTH